MSVFRSAGLLLSIASILPINRLRATEPPDPTRLLIPASAFGGSSGAEIKSGENNVTASPTQNDISNETDASKELARLVALIQSQIHSRKWPNIYALSQKMIVLAQTNKLSSDPGFQQTFALLHTYASSIPLDMEKLDRQFLQLASPDDTPNQITDTACGTVAGKIMFSGAMARESQDLTTKKLENEEHTYPICTLFLDPMIKTRISMGLREEGKSDEADKIDPSTKEIYEHSQEEMAKRQPLMNALRRVKNGDWCGLANLIPPDLQDPSDETHKIPALEATFLWMMCGDSAKARHYALMIPNDKADSSVNEHATLPGYEDINGPLSQDSSSAFGISIATTYHLRLARQDEHAARNALEVILRDKGRDSDRARARIKLLNSGSNADDNLYLRLMREYAKASDLWAKQAIEKQKVSGSEFEAEAERMHELEDKVDTDLSQVEAIEPTSFLESVQGALKSGDALVEFVEVWLPEYTPSRKPPMDDQNVAAELHYVAYVLRSNGTIHTFDLGGSTKIEKQILEYRASIDQYSADLAKYAFIKKGLSEQSDLLTEKIHRCARALYDSLWRPLFSGPLESGHVYVSPDSMVNVVPFDALMDTAGEYLIKHWDISYVESGRDLLRFRSNSPKHFDINVFADRFSDASGKTAHNVPTLRPLPNALIEAQAVKQYFPRTTIFSDESATKANLMRLQSPTVLHFTTHGYYFDPNGSSAYANTQYRKQQKYRFLRSGLILDDGVLTSLEISLMKLDQTDLVVLSACDSGLSDVTLGDNVSGLRGAFHMAGARTLVSVLWRENDAAGRVVMDHFYEGLSNGENFNDALRHAKLRLISDERYSEAYYWAPFVLEGDVRKTLLNLP